jgi:hypothetical protein
MNFQPTRLLQWLLRCVYLVLLLAILYLSLRGSPSMRELPWLPGWLSVWADRHGELRTAVPYGAAALMCPWLLQVDPHRLAAARRWLYGQALGLFSALLLTEGAQCFLVHRTASLADIAWGTLGIVLGGALRLLGTRLGCVSCERTASGQECPPS